MPYKYRFREEDVPAQHALCVRRTTTLPNVEAVVREILSEVAEYVKELGVEASGPPFACYHAIGTDSVDVEAGLPVAAPGRSRWQIRAIELLGGPAVVLSHAGPYEPVTYAAEALDGWLAKNERKAEGPLIEVYDTDPNRVTDRRRLRVRVFQGLQKPSVRRLRASGATR
jgi:effector-binding domain-containing protein